MNAGKLCVIGQNTSIRNNNIILHADKSNIVLYINVKQYERIHNKIKH